MKKLLLLGAAVAALIQFIPAPPKTNPQSEPARTFAVSMKPPAVVQNILQRACFDCHSNETKWPWYADVAPVAWPVRKHVKTAANTSISPNGSSPARRTSQLGVTSKTSANPSATRPCLFPTTTGCTRKRNSRRKTANPSAYGSTPPSPAKANNQAASRASTYSRFPRAPNAASI